MSNKYLLEIGVEELPAGMINDALQQLKDKTGKMFKDERIKFDKIDAYYSKKVNNNN